MLIAVRGARLYLQIEIIIFDMIFVEDNILNEFFNY